MSKLVTGRKKTGGRKKGTPNKINALLKDDILTAANEAHPDGRVGYLTEQAKENPTAFLTLLGKVLPIDMTTGGKEIKMPQQIIMKAVAASHADSDD